MLREKFSTEGPKNVPEHRERGEDEAAVDRRAKLLMEVDPHYANNMDAARQIARVSINMEKSKKPKPKQLTVEEITANLKKEKEKGPPEHYDPLDPAN